MPKKMKYIGEEEREVPQYGVFKPGDVVDFDENLHKTGLFSVVNSKKEGDK
jgi:hypothetical protein